MSSISGRTYIHMNVRMMYKLKAVPYEAATIVDIYIKMQCNDDSDNNIIMMQVLPKNAIDQYQTIFSHIATPVDMETYPSQYNRDYPYFRTDKAVIRVNSMFQAQQLLKGLASRVRQLNRSITALEAQDQAIFTDGTDL